ncbi:putative abhydrolase domain-containing protein [Abeliophyllum distichum]|uniref:Abhydrolase domain-containing protein n=1 Tax=Abeliophyllum distichum TaxID=126358 RepID=A0ABD1RCK0_9LAMI
MSSSATRGDTLGRVGNEASPSVSPSMEGILPIRGVDGNTGKAISIDVAPSLREADDPFRADVVRWTTLDVPSIMVEEDLTKLRKAYRIPADIELMLPGPNERAYFPRKGCTALHLNAFVSGMRLYIRYFKGF